MTGRIVESYSRAREYMYDSIFPILQCCQTTKQLFHLSYLFIEGGCKAGESDAPASSRILQ
jgi:hypothetical protein